MVSHNRRWLHGCLCRLLSTEGRTDWLALVKHHCLWLKVLLLTAPLLGHLRLLCIELLIMLLIMLLLLILLLLVSCLACLFTCSTLTNFGLRLLQWLKLRLLLLLLFFLEDALYPLGFIRLAAIKWLFFIFVNPAQHKLIITLVARITCFWVVVFENLFKIIYLL